MGKFNPAVIKKPKSKKGVSQGYFIPTNPQKYVGTNVNIITYRSSWEKDLMFTCDLNPAVVQWAAEPFCIPYFDPVTQLKRQYWPDFLITYMKPDGTLVQEVVEIKPYKQCLLENAKSRKAKMTVITNQAKWQAAQAFCDANGLVFRIMTERQLYSRGK